MIGAALEPGPPRAKTRSPDGNIATALREMARRRPDAIAVQEPIETDGEGRIHYARWSFRQLDEEVDRLCHALTSVGIERGTRTVLMVPPSRRFFALSFALFRLGAVPVLVDPGMGIPSLKACLDRAAPEAFIGVSRAHLARCLFGWARRSIRIRITVGRKPGGRLGAGLLPWRGPTLASLRRRIPPRTGFTGPVTQTDETAAILFTSGSTGTPKGAIYHHGIFLEQIEQLRRLYAIEEGEVDLPPFPLFGLFDVALGMTAVIPSMDFTRPGSADPAGLLHAIEQEGVTNLFASPALLRNLARHVEERGVDLPGLRRVLSAGAPVPAAEIERLARRLAPGVQVHTPYGATECLPVASIGSDAIVGGTGIATTEGAGVCVGRIAPGMEVGVIPVHDEPIERWDPALLLSPGEVGEIVVRGAVVSRAYHDHPAGNAAAKIGPAPGEPDTAIRHRIGDLGRFDAEGRLWFQGRKAHRVWTPDGPLDTIAAEGVFNAHPAVARTALVGLGRRGAQVPLLCVELEAGSAPAQETLLRELRVLGARFPHTAGIDRFRIHPGFPVDIRHNAKIFREKLALWAGTA
ncbi:MAG: fatty acid CoA ligase family protein [Planctomycetota bacterium]